MSLQNKRLKPKDTQDFFHHYYQGLLSEGLIKPLHNFPTPNVELQQALHSLAEALTQGKPFAHALQSMSPAFPILTETLLSHAEACGALDQAVAQLISLDALLTQPTVWASEMTRFVSDYENNAQSAFICRGCFERELQSIWQRAQLERAQEVYLEQNSGFFEQKYVGAKLIWVRIPSHALSYATLWQQLKQASQEASLQLSEQSFKLKAITSNQFLLEQEQQTLMLYFKKN